MSNKRPSFNSAEGSALIVVVFTLLFATAITGRLISDARSDLQLAATHDSQFVDELADEAGTAVAIIMLSDPGGGAVKDNGEGVTVNAGGKPIRLSIENEAGKINLNHAPNPLLKRLLETLCADNPAASQLWSALEAELAAATSGRRAFARLDQIRRLPGGSAAIVAALEPYVSVYSFREVPDFGLAPARLQALMAEGGNSTGLSARQSINTGQRPRSGIFRILASAGAGAAIESVIYITGDATQPSKLLDWRRRPLAEATDCGGEG